MVMVVDDADGLLAEQISVRWTGGCLVYDLGVGGFGDLGGGDSKAIPHLPDCCHSEKSIYLPEGRGTGVLVRIRGRVVN